MSEQDSREAQRTAEWAVENCHMLARREIRRLQHELTEQGGTGMTPVTLAIHTWEHVIRICELTGYRSPGVLREQPAPSNGEAEREAERQRWQPIETAPKDCEFLSFDEGAFAITHWQDADEYGPDGWYDESGALFGPPPTHWMPLPAPPERKEPR